MAEYRRAEQVFEHARSLAEPGHELSERELWKRGVNRHAQGEHRAALDLLDRAVRKGSEAEARPAVPGAPGALRLTSPTFFRVCCLVELGEFDEALVWAERDFDLAQAMPHAYRLIHAVSARGFVHLRRGAAAIGPLEHAHVLGSAGRGLSPPGPHRRSGRARRRDARVDRTPRGARNPRVGALALRRDPGAAIDRGRMPDGTTLSTSTWMRWPVPATSRCAPWWRAAISGSARCAAPSAPSGASTLRPPA